MFLSDSLPSEICFRQAYTLSRYLSVMGRVSPVPNHTSQTYRFPYTERFFCAAFPVSSHVPWFSLYITVYMFAYSSYRGYFIHSLSTLYYYNAPSLATRLTGDYRDRTYNGNCGPASLDTLHKNCQQINLYWHEKFIFFQLST